MPKTRAQLLAIEKFKREMISAYIYDIGEDCDKCGKFKPDINLVGPGDFRMCCGGGLKGLRPCKCLFEDVPDHPKYSHNNSHESWLKYNKYLSIKSKDKCRCK